MKKIIFRADGNSKTGLGHLYRIFALIEIFKNNFDYLFLTRESSATNVIPTGYRYKTIPGSLKVEDEPKWLNENYPSSGYLIMADGYEFNSSYQKSIKAMNYKLFYVDDLAAEHMYADIVVNHSASIKVSDYKAEAYTKFALGTGYAILRPGFLEAAKRSRSVTRIETVFVCFGGADQFNLTTIAAKALLNVEGITKINIVIGAAFGHPEIFELAKKYPQVKVYQNISESELIKVMEDCHMAIAPASTVLYELCAIKMPVLSGYFVENQKNIYKGCVDHHLIFEGGDFKTYTVKDFENKIKMIIVGNDYQKWMDAQAKLFDSKIKERFLGLLSGITYRRACAEDLMQVFIWANDKLSRANSYFTDPITLETHKNWFEKKLKDTKSIIYIAEVENKPAGMIRYDMAEENTVVGILVGEDFRGKGLAAEFLTGTAKLYFKENTKPVLAYIKKENSASVRSFEKSNYRKIKEEVVRGYDSFIYRLENYDV